MKSHIVPLASLLALASKAVAQCDLPDQYQWTDSGVLTEPQNGWTSLKDFTIAPYEGGQLVYATKVENSAWGSMNFGVFSDFGAMSQASQNAQASGGIAPTLFYFEPSDQWILAYQWGPHTFNYKTSSNPTDPNSWGSAQPLYEGSLSDSDTGPIDQTLIADDENIYLFFAGDNGKIYRQSMPLGQFPGSFGNSAETILQDTTDNLFEAVQVYKLAGLQKYLMIVEAIGSPARYIRSFTASSLGGQWELQSNAFANKQNTGATWTDDISHGELVRSTADQTFEVDACNLQFLYQGRDPSVNVEYVDLPYRPGLITLQNPA